uniref:Uncharacterized protein n=1 Tax=Arundo donax TaxID=35708 RepID=A0A0A8XWJ1_ARUDO
MHRNSNIDAVMLIQLCLLQSATQSIAIPPKGTNVQELEHVQYARNTLH